MNSELMNILVSSVVTGLIVMVVTWSIATAGAARQVEEAVRDASLRGKDMGRSEYLASPEFVRKLREAHEVGVSVATEEMAAKVEKAYFKGVEDGTVDAGANHAADLVAARKSGFREGRAVSSGEEYEAGYRDGEKQGYREGYEACDADIAKADELGGSIMEAIDEALKVVNLPEFQGVESISVATVGSDGIVNLVEQKDSIAYLKNAVEKLEAQVEKDEKAGYGEVKHVKTDVKSKPVKAKPVKPVKEKAAKIPEVLRRKPTKSPLVPPKEVKAPTRVKAAKPVKKPVADAGECPPCKPWEKTRRSR